MGVISLSDVQSAPPEAVTLYDKYRPLIAQGAPVEKLKQELLADCTALNAQCDIDCQDCVNEVAAYLLRCFER